MVFREKISLDLWSHEFVANRMHNWLSLVRTHKLISGLIHYAFMQKNNRDSGQV